MTGKQVIHKVFSKVYGRPCWNCHLGYGASLTFEFGNPHLETREPRKASRKASKAVRALFARRRIWVRGDWHLWVYCCKWTVSMKGKTVASTNSSWRLMERAAYILDGQKLMKVAVNPKQGRTVFEFDLGGRLEAEPYGKDDQDSELWLLFEHSGRVLSVRSDGKYSYQNGNIPPKLQQWRDL